ncbi:MAG: T9SS type A sorting domain-containing protein [bacterium]|nr:T9SS type A sorting domain-containing protein [bacterium]
MTAASPIEDVPKFANRLNANAPNPFNPRTKIDYEVGSAGRVTLRVFDVRGKAVRLLVDRELDAGRYRLTWDGTDDRGRRLASGVYFCRMEAANFVQIIRMALIK